MDQIITGVGRHVPDVNIVRVRDVGLASASDDEVLDFAAREHRIVVSHDVNTMRAAAVARVERGAPMTGPLLVRQTLPVWTTIEDLIFIESASEAEEWNNLVSFLPL